MSHICPPPLHFIASTLYQSAVNFLSFLSSVQTTLSLNESFERLELIESLYSSKVFNGVRYLKGRRRRGGGEGERGRRKRWRKLPVEQNKKSMKFYYM